MACVIVKILQIHREMVVAGMGKEQSDLLGGEHVLFSPSQHPPASNHFKLLSNYDNELGLVPHKLSASSPWTLICPTVQVTIM